MDEPKEIWVVEWGNITRWIFDGGYESRAEAENHVDRWKTLYRHNYRIRRYVPAESATSIPEEWHK
jgi:hypothetical protein